MKARVVFLGIGIILILIGAAVFNYHRTVTIPLAYASKIKLAEVHGSVYPGAKVFAEKVKAASDIWVSGTHGTNAGVTAYAEIPGHSTLYGHRIYACRWYQSLQSFVPRQDDVAISLRGDPVLCAGLIIIGIFLSCIGIFAHRI